MGSAIVLTMARPIQHEHESRTALARGPGGAGFLLITPLEVPIDDYGTGYSSLSYLRDLPVQELKNDRCFVAGILTNPRDRIVVKATHELARGLGLRTVAEGVRGAAFGTGPPVPFEQYERHTAWDRPGGEPGQRDRLATIGDLEVDANVLGKRNCEGAQREAASAPATLRPTTAAAR